MHVDVLVAPCSGTDRGDLAGLLLDAAERAGLGPQVVISTMTGFQVPPAVAYAAGLLPAPAPPAPAAPIKRGPGRPRKHIPAPQE